MGDIMEVDSTLDRPRRSIRNNMTGSKGDRVLVPVTSSRVQSLRVKNGPAAKRRKNNDDGRLTFMKLEQVEMLSQEMYQSSYSSNLSARNSSGIIKSLTLYNFMCHESFHQEWHENINFIVGENGSGKSALLSGLLIGLGSKALTTSRTSSIKDLIKTGKEFAKIEIILLNRGLISEDVYGREVTIQRILDVRGATTYKIQKNGGKSRPLKKPELDKILLDLNIQLSNPVVILNQESARSFLCSKNPKDKYKLFQDGIGAQQCEEILDEITDDIEKIADNLEKKKEDVNKALAKYDMMKDKIKILDGATAHKERMKFLTCELAWRNVADVEKISKEAKKEMEKSVEAYIKTEEAYKKGLEQKEQLADTSAPSADVQAERKRQKEILEIRKTAMRDSINGVRREMASAKMKASSNKTLVVSKKKAVTNLTARAAQDDEKAKEDHERLKQQIVEQKEELKVQIKSVSQEIETLHKDSNDFLKGADAIRADLQSVTNKRREVENVLNKKKTQLRQLKTSADTKSYDAFGPRMAILVDKINSSKRKFHQLPKGPLGSCFQVNNHEYLNIVQYFLRARLCDFIVDNARDSQFLNSLITSVYGTTPVADSPRPNVILTKFCGPHDYSTTNASRGLEFRSVIDMLDIENNDHIITNALLDMCLAERFLLFRDTTEALSILEEQSTTPKMCKGGFTLDFFKITPDPNLRVDAIKARRNEPQLIRTSPAMQIRSLTMEIQSLEQELSKYILDTEKVKEEKELRKEYETRNEAFKDKRIQLSSLKLRFDSLKEPKDRRADQSSVNDELQEIQSELEKLEAEIIEQTEVYEARRSLLEEKEAEKAVVDTELEDIHKEISNYYDFQEKQKEKARKLDLYIEKLKTQMEDSEAKKVSKEEEYLETEATVAESTRKAKERGERVETKRAIKDIIKESGLIKAKLGEIDKAVGNREDILKEFEVTKTDYEKIHTHWTIVDSIHKDLQVYAGKVRAYYLLSRDRLVDALKQCFESIVKSRGYKGSVIIDHEKKELYYFICPDEESSEKMSLFQGNLSSAKYKSKMMEYVAGLSGGERSFSTICFIISMWQAMKSPFYMLDEFDVFMDAVNRKTSQQALISHAKTFPNNQFFFFTPLDLTSVPSKEEALVLRMYPPKRDTSAINEQDIFPVDGEPVSTTSTSSRRRRGPEIRPHSSSKNPRI